MALAVILKRNWLCCWQILGYKPSWGLNPIPSAVVPHKKLSVVSRGVCPRMLAPPAAGLLRNSRVSWRQQTSLGAVPARRPWGRRAVPEPLSCPVAVGQVEELKCPNLVLSPSLIFLSWCFLPPLPFLPFFKWRYNTFFSGGTKDLCLSSCSLDLLLIHVVSCLLL